MHVPPPPTAEEAISLAADLLREAEAHGRGATRAQRSRHARMAAIVGDPIAQSFVMTLTDEVSRIADRRRAAARFAAIVSDADLGSLGLTDRVLLRAAALATRVAPRQVMALVERRLRAESSGVVLDADPSALARHLRQRRDQAAVPNVNVLGEAILSDAEADRRLQLVLEQLRRPDVSYVSVKISALCAHPSALAFDQTVAAAAVPVRELFRLAAASTPAKFVNLDMEEYRDLALTTTLFRSVLDEPEFAHLSAGIVLQAYLPDSHGVADDLCRWARERVANGGAPIKIRVVKGANLAMETVEAELHGWALATFSTKHEVDASFKRMLDALLDPINDGAVRVGLASHNVFDIAWGLLLRDRLAVRGHADRLEFEMLEGMAPAHGEVLRERAGSLLLYSPIVARDDFAAAIAYLVRRLDENTAPENFLTALFAIEPDNAVFYEQAERFRAAVRDRGSIDVTPRRTQVRPGLVPAGACRWPRAFENEPDTDFAIEANRSWLAGELSGWVAPEPPPVATEFDVDAAMGRAVEARRSWSQVDAPERAALIARIGDVVAARRGEVLATMAQETGKSVGEGDPEVSEAIDFARYYAGSIEEIERLGAEGSASHPLGTVVVVPPWNFPFAIALGGVTAALAAGNTVVLKPAPQSVLCGALVARCCWEAGIPDDVVQLVAAPDDDAGRALVTHRHADGVILTGSLATAQMFLDWKPALRLHAETSGKNAMVITATADLDAALKDLVKSAFGHAGQKCSAASLAIVEASVHDDAGFQRRLRDAVETLHVGWPDDLSIDVGPLIGAPGPDLRRALTTLEPGERWLVESRCLDGARVWTPGVRVGVRAGSWFARTECFGPVLGVIRAGDLDEAIAIANSTDFGLTAGLHALDPAEIEYWCERVQAGNLYVNRGITGAIVRRQPFGGWKQSVVGPTVKAGGPAYVASLRHWPAPAAIDIDLVEDRFRRWAAEHDKAEVDPTGLRAERNTLRLRPLGGGVALRLGTDAPAAALTIARAAAQVLATRLVVSDAATEGDDAFAARVGELGVDRLRIVGSVGDQVRRAAVAAGVAVDERDLHPDPRIELPRWRREQAVARTMHRYGRVTPL